MIDKAKFKEDILKICNDILEKNGEYNLMEEISVMNMSSKIIFLGSLKVFDESKISTINNELTKSLEKLGKLTIKHQRVVPCCSLPFEQISFQITVFED
ncbi:MAG: hypothetical protein MJ209_01490 [archaeon]|nr:hypothetical protein [archaeon]